MQCRFLYVVGQLGPGGLERQLYLLLKTLDRDRYRPEVVVWNFRENDTYVRSLQALDIPLHVFPSQYSRLAKLKAFRRLVRQVKPEVVHSYSFYTNVAAWWAALRTNTVAVGAVRSNFINDKTSSSFLLGGLNARWPRTQIYNNFAAAEKARNSWGPFCPRKALVVRNALDLAEFQKKPLSMNGRVRIVGVGSLIQVKRWDRLLSAASNMKAKGLEFELDIIGDGPLRESLEQQAQRLEVGDRVKFKGHSDDVSALLSNATFLAHTSDIEGCPNVVMEAMACGRPVVATDAGDVRLLVDDGKTGFVVPRGDDAKLGERLAALITNRKLCREMGEAGRNKAEREFGLDRFIMETIVSYKIASSGNF